MGNLALALMESHFWGVPFHSRCKLEICNLFKKNSFTAGVMGFLWTFKLGCMPICDDVSSFVAKIVELLMLIKWIYLYLLWMQAAIIHFWTNEIKEKMIIRKTSPQVFFHSSFYRGKAWEGNFNLKCTIFLALVCELNHLALLSIYKLT